MKRLTFLALGLVMASGMSACSATDSVAPKPAVKKELTCRSGYLVFWRNGVEVCEPAGGGT